MSQHRLEQLAESDDHRVYAAHIEDLWNSQVYHPDLRYPIVLNITTGDEEEELRLSIEAGRKILGDLTRAIQEAENDLKNGHHIQGNLQTGEFLKRIKALKNGDTPG